MKKQIKKRGVEKNSATPWKLSPIKAVMDTTPNYMKSTSSSDARKERDLHVSSRSPRTSSDCKRSFKRKSLESNKNPSLNSTNITAVTNFTKTPSFKTTSAKKCSQMIPWENLKVQRVTCSSTIRKLEFPAYLNPSPGATGAEGTSSMKVCPYTYCSCNGHHHHDALPPLKSFMTAKRHIVKAQRNIKLRCPSPCRKKPVQDNMEEAKAQRWNSQEHPTSNNTSSFQEEHGEYFIEIYSKNKELMSWNNQNIADCSVSHIEVSDDVQDEPTTDNRKGQRNSLGNPLDAFLEKNHNTAVREKLYTPKSDQGKIELDFLKFLYEMDVESAPSIQSEETDMENDCLDKNAGDFIGGSQNGGQKSIKIDDMINVEQAHSPLNNALFPDGVGKVCDVSFPNNIMQELKDDDIAYESWSGDDGSELFSLHRNIFDDEIHNKIATDGFDDHLDDMVGADSAIFDINGHALAMINGAQSSDVLSQKMNQEIEDGHYIGSQAYERDHDMSKNPIKKLTNCISTQTENEYEYQQDISWKLDQVHTRSIGTQTDFEDDDIASTCFQMDQVASGIMNEEEGKRSIDGIENITLLQNSDEEENQTVAGETDNGTFSSEDDEKESGLDEGIAESAHLGTNRTQEAVSAENWEKHDGGCLPEKIAKLNRITKGNAHFIRQNEEQREFNPRAPNFLPEKPDLSAEKVDLRHLTLDEKRNEDEWKVDYALQQALAELAPARKRKVALLVEAFETVTPTPNESDSRISSTA